MAQGMGIYKMFNSSKHLCMGTATMKYDKETEGEGKKRRVNIEISTAERKK